MAAEVRRLVPRAEVLDRERAAEARQLVLQLEPSAPQLVGQMLALIDRRTVAEKGWSFVMLSPAQNRLVVRWINEHARRPRISAAIWAECFCHMRMDTGEVCMTRQQMAEAVGAPARDVSEAMNELASKVGALIRHQEGRDVRWFMNPRVGTHLSGAAREKAQKDAPSLLSLVEGGPGRG
jgi:CRP-like cAMP-binding protein